MIYTQTEFFQETRFHKISASFLVVLDTVPIVSSIFQVARCALKLIADLFLAVANSMKFILVKMTKDPNPQKLFNSPISKWHQAVVLLFKSVYIDELFKKSYARCIVDMVPIASNLYELSKGLKEPLLQLKEAAINQISSKNHTPPYCYMEPYCVASYLKLDKEVHLEMVKLNPFTIQYFDEALFQEKDFVQNLLYEVSFHFDQEGNRLSETAIQNLLKMIFEKSKESDFLIPLKPLIESDFKAGSRKELIELATLFPIVAFALASKLHFQNFVFLNKVKQFYPHVLTTLPNAFLKLHKGFVLDILIQSPNVFYRMPKAFQQSQKDFEARVKSKNPK